MRCNPLIVTMLAMSVVASQVAAQQASTHTTQQTASQQTTQPSVVQPLTPPDSAADPYVRYTRPGECVQAANRLKDLYWRDKRPDTVRYIPETDSVPTPVLKAARQCASRFGVATVPVRDLLGLVQLYLWTRQDSLAKAAADRLLTAQAKDPALERGWTLHLLVDDLLDVRPVHGAWAQQYLAQLDSLGQPAAAWQMLAHTTMAMYDMTRNKRTASLANGKAAVAASRAMSKNDRMDRALQILSAYNALAEPMSLIDGGPATLALFDTAKADITPLRRTKMDLGMLLQLLGEMRRPYTLVDTKAKPIVGKHWYHMAGDTTVQPKAGAVTLVFIAHPACGGQCFSQYATLHRLYDKYGASGLHVVTIVEAMGFFRTHLEPNAAEESDDVQKYLLGYLKLPGPLVVNETTFHHIFDGRQIPQPGPNAEGYIKGRSGIVVGKDGVIHMVSSVDPKHEDALAAEIAALLKQ